jgi:hypothetical protein
VGVFPVADAGRDGVAVGGPRDCERPLFRRLTQASDWRILQAVDLNR